MVNYLVNFYKHIDLVVSPPGSYQVFPELSYITAHETKWRFVEFNEDQPPLQQPRMLSNDQYPEVEYALDKPLTDDSICCITHSSGTTGEPKIIKTSHRHAIALVKENIKIFDFNSNDKILHYKTLHHGSLFLNYAIPAFCTSDFHHWIVWKSGKETRDEFVQRCLDYCNKNKITKWLVSHNNRPVLDIIVSPALKSCNLSSTSLITVVGPTLETMQQVFSKFNPKNVYNNFGCTELGTLVVSKTTAKNLNEYAPNKFSIFNPMIDFEIHESFFKAKYKDEQEWKTIGDIVKILDNVFYWEGRNIYINVEQEKIRIHDVSKWVFKFLKSSAFAVVPDLELNMLYLAVFDTNINTSLEKINHTIKSSPGLKNCFFSKFDYIEFKEVFQGIKPSQPVLLYYFRNKSN